MEQEVEEESCSRTGEVCVFEASASGLAGFDRDHVLFSHCCMMLQYQKLAIIFIALRKGEGERLR